MTTPHALTDVPICFGAPFLSFLFLNKLLVHTSQTSTLFLHRMHFPLLPLPTQGSAGHHGRSKWAPGDFCPTGNFFTSSTLHSCWVELPTRLLAAMCLLTAGAPPKRRHLLGPF